MVRTKKSMEKLKIKKLSSVKVAEKDACKLCDGIKSVWAESVICYGQQIYDLKKCPHCCNTNKKGKGIKDV